MNLLQDMEEDEISCILKKKVTDLIGESSICLDEQTYDKYRDRAFRIAAVGEEAGFYRGFRYAMRLFAECI